MVALIRPKSGQEQQGQGRRLLDREPIVRAILRSSYHPGVRGVDGASALWRELQNNETHRNRAGFQADGSDLCSRPTVQRTIQAMADHWDLFLERFNELTDEIKEADPEFGEEMAVDGAAVWSHCNPNRKTRAFRKSGGCDPRTCQVRHRCNGNAKPNRRRRSRSDQEAWWKFTYKSRANKGIAWVYGFGILAVARVKTQRPIGLQVYTPTVGEKCRRPKVRKPGKGYQLVGRESLAGPAGRPPALRLPVAAWQCGVDGTVQSPGSYRAALQRVAGSLPPEQPQTPGAGESAAARGAAGLGVPGKEHIRRPSPPGGRAVGRLACGRVGAQTKMTARTLSTTDGENAPVALVV